MMKIKNLISLITLLLITSVSAGGLSIEQDSINISKMYNNDYEISLKVINEEDFKFENVGFEEDFINADLFDLEAGENKTVTFTIDIDDDFDGYLTLRGEYETNIGQSNKTVQVNIDYTTGLSICNMDLIIGDKIQWNNLVMDEIKLYSTSDFATILEENNYTKTFNYVEEFTYYAKRNGAKFTESCMINVMDDSGLVHSLQYDYKLPTKIKINYEPTNVTATFLETEYEVEYDDEQEDIFALKNIGNKEGKKIHLEADWIEFDDNDFDLEVGQSKNIGYTINPLIYLTNQTNKTYKVEIKITGNFETITQEIKIKIPYAVVSSSYGSVVADPEFMDNLYAFYCDLMPDATICVKTTNGDGTTTTIEYSQETITGLLNAEAKRQDEQTLFQKQQLEINQQTINQLNESNNKLENITKELVKTKEVNDNLKISIYFIIGFVLLCVFAFIAYEIIMRDAKKDTIKNNAKFSKGEFEW